MWDVDTGNWRGFLEDTTENGKASTLALGADGTVLVGYGHGPVTLWQVETRTRLVSFLAHAGPVTSLACAGDGTRWFSGGADGAFQVWQSPDAIRLLRTPADVPIVRDLALSPDGRTLVSLGDDGTVGFWGTGL
jgi:WD40 repeat protein